MSKVCQLTGKKPASGHNVSHSVRRTKRRFLPNLQWKKIFDPVTKTFVRVRICTAAMRTLVKPLTNKQKRKIEKKTA